MLACFSCRRLSRCCCYCIRSDRMATMTTLDRLSSEILSMRVHFELLVARRQFNCPITGRFRLANLCDSHRQTLDAHVPAALRWGLICERPRVGRNFFFSPPSNRQRPLKEPLVVATNRTDSDSGDYRQQFTRLLLRVSRGSLIELEPAKLGGGTNSAG